MFIGISDVILKGILVFMSHVNIIVGILRIRGYFGLEVFVK